MPVAGSVNRLSCSGAAAYNAVCRGSPPPYSRLLACWLCSVLASGLLPGQVLFVKLFANAGVFASSCETLGTCKLQFIELSTLFAVASHLSLLSVPIAGVLYDRLGARWCATVGTAACMLGVFLLSACLLGVQRGLDSIVNPAFIVAVLICDFGSCMSSVSIVGFLWQFQGRQAFVLASYLATKSAAAFNPLLVECVMVIFNLGLGGAFFLYGLALLGATVLVWRLTPSMKCYYAAAEAVLGTPLPKPLCGFDPLCQFRRAVTVLKFCAWDHLTLGVSCALFMLAGEYYAAISAGYGGALFWSAQAGTQLAEIYVFISGLAGLGLIHLGGVVADVYGLQALLALIISCGGLGLVTCSIASWTAQCVCSLSFILAAALTFVFGARYWTMHAPPSQFGTTQSTFVTLCALINFPFLLAGMWYTSMAPPGPGAYQHMMFLFGLVGTGAMCWYAAYFQDNPPPVQPPLLHDEDLMYEGCHAK